MSRITITDPVEKPRVLPTFAVHPISGDFYIIHNTHNGGDAITWAVNMNKNGERVRFDAIESHELELLPVGTILSVVV